MTGHAVVRVIVALRNNLAMTDSCHPQGCNTSILVLFDHHYCLHQGWEMLRTMDNKNVNHALADHGRQLYGAVIQFRLGAPSVRTLRTFTGNDRLITG